jgi:hypothetical protein
MATLAPDAMLIGISTPYRKAGLLYRKYRDHYGKDGDDVLVIKAPTTALNPTIDTAIIEAALIEDPAAAAAEWLAEFRDDIAGWASYELIEAAVDRDVLVRPPLPDVTYYSFIDGSGGVRDSYCAAIAHNENDVAILDCLIEIKAPFDPDSATTDVAKVLKSYRCFSTTGDHYSAEWIVGAYAKAGITYRHSDRDRSAIYLDALPLFTTGRVRLIDNKRLVTQLASLERKTMPSGKDRVDHGPGGHDDAANVAAGAMVLERREKLLAPPKPRPGLTQEMINRGMVMPPSSEEELARQEEYKRLEEDRKQRLAPLKPRPGLTQEMISKGMVMPLPSADEIARQEEYKRLEEERKQRASQPSVPR